MSFSNKKWVIVLIAVAFLAGLGWQMFKPSGIVGGQAKRYGKVRRGDLVQRVTVSGLVHPQRRTNFVAPYAGYVRKVFVVIGQKVQQNDPVISIASSLTGSEEVFPLRAPFSGTVVDVSKTEGEYVAERDIKDPMIRIDDLTKYFVVAKAPELDAARIKKEMDVDIRINALKAPGVRGVVRSIDLAAQEADGWRQQQSSFDVRVEISNPPEGIRSGQSAILDIVTDKFANVLSLEHEFINQEGDNYFVITRKGERRPIQVGRQSDMAMEITQGLAEGDEVEQVDFLKLLESGR